MEGILSSPATALIIIACLVAKLGGKVVIEQADVDNVAFHMIVEDMKEGENSITIELVEKTTLS